MKFTSFEKEKKSTSLADRVAEAMADEDLKNERHATGPRASSLVGSCIRQQWYDLMQMEHTDTSNYKSPIYKGVGVYSHELWQVGLVASGVCDKDEGIEVEFTEGESGTEAIVHVGLEWETKGSEAFEDEDAEEEEDDEEEDAESAAA